VRLLSPVRSMLRGVLGVTALTALTVVVAPRAHAQVFNFNSGGLSARATFSQSGSDLMIVLENLAGGPVTANGDVLTSLFWTDGKSSAYTPFSLSAPGGLIDQNGNPYTPSAGGLEGGWQYKTLSYSGYNHGLSAVGATHFGPTGNFPGGSGAPLDGVGWGIVTPGSNPSGNQEPFALNSMTFVLGGYGENTNINAAAFNYSSNLDVHAGTPGASSVPEPASLALLAGGVPFFLRRRRTRA
jgi:hypothetical protein